MLTASTIEQILKVIQKTREFYGGGEPIERAYNLACNIVRKQENVAYETIADGCVRRLGFVGYGATGQFHKVLREWLHNNSGELRNLLLTKADKGASQLVIAFFEGTDECSTVQPTEVFETGTMELSFKLPINVGKKLRVIAEAKGQSPSEWVSKRMADVIDSEFRDLLDKLIKTMPDNDKLIFLKGLERR